MTDHEESGWLKSAKELLVEHIAEEGPQASISPAMVLRKEGSTEVAFECGDVRLLCGLAKIAVAGFEADELLLVSDAYRSDSPTNPEGRPWGHEEMQKRSHEPAVKALLSEQLIVMQAQKGKDRVTLDVLRYSREEGGIRWYRDEAYEKARKDESFRLDGLLQELLVAAVNEPSILNSGAAWLGETRETLLASFGLAPNVVQLHTRIAAVRYMIGEATRNHEMLGVLWRQDNDEDAQIVKQSLERFGDLDAVVLRDETHG